LARKILLADDSVTAQNMGRRILIDAGYEVVTVNNGSAALKKIFEVKPDLIVLDVYMPGYGGLEICQRVRENPETARIPVLLTVGKLEPFKADEARRVRADAFVIKPFEASELLTALTRLEDKIVPSGQRFTPGRFAKAVAEIEDAGGRPIDFGDTETGWKNRLKIPPPHAKHEPEVVAPVATSRSYEETPRPEVRPEETMAPVQMPEPPSVLAGVTPDEIAAITAAVAAFSSEGQIHDPQPANQIPAPIEMAVVPDAAAPPIVKEEEPAAVTFASAPQFQAEAVSDVVSENVVPVAEPKPAEVEPVVEGPAANSGEEEVAAALASLAPTNGNGADQQENAGPVESPEPMPVAAMADAQTFSGPRWIADEVPVPEDEAGWSLEAEMSRSFAAFAAADAARTILGVATADFRMPSAEAEVSSAPTEGSFGSNGSGTPEPAAPTSVEAISENSVSEPQPEAAYAAAAGASTEAVAPRVAEMTQPAAPEVTGSQPPPVEQVPSQQESELAAAWASWKNVRESFVGSHLASPIAEATAAAAQEVKPETAATAEAASEATIASEAAEEAGAIASIVDSVLAELKPRLMEEISRKMGKDKKK
jgi:CheY-like chemotaxis protein